MLLVTFTINAVFASAKNLKSIAEEKTTVPSYVGVTFGGNTTAQAKLLVDRVKSYTNLFVIQSGPVSKNETAMKEISQYAIDAGLNLLVYFGWLDPQQPWQLPWLKSAKQQWGDQFLGVYFDDEPNGIPLDYNWTGYFATQRQQNSTEYRAHSFAIDGILNQIYPHDHDEAAAISQSAIEKNLKPLKDNSLKTFTSDYVLYWFGYKGGYDVMLAQLGYNESITQNVDLIRGAARLQNKEWGVILTWKYSQPPYLDTGQEIYNQMLTSYESGAKYIIVFNYPQIEGNPYGVLQDEHFEALEEFWNTIKATKSLPDFSQAIAVLILPDNYGWGMRRPDDKIWGFWGPDEKSAQIWNTSRILLSVYGLRLDIIYEDSAFLATGKYQQIYYWNQTISAIPQGSQPSMNSSAICPALTHKSKMMASS